MGFSAYCLFLILLSKSRPVSEDRVPRHFTGGGGRIYYTPQTPSTVRALFSKKILGGPESGQETGNFPKGARLLAGEETVEDQ